MEPGRVATHHGTELEDWRRRANWCTCGCGRVTIQDTESFKWKCLTNPYWVEMQEVIWTDGMTGDL